jgi:predicted nucleic acid-binding protein
MRATLIQMKRDTAKIKLSSYLAEKLIMTIAEQIYEIVKALPQNQAREILTFAEFIFAKHMGTSQSTSKIDSSLPFEREAALAAARIRAQLEQQGTPIGSLDVLIAGTAIALQATLVTHNVREFSRVPGLAIVDWY